MNDDELMDKLKTENTFNPWLDVGREWLSDIDGGRVRDTYIHPDDEAVVSEHTIAVQRWCEKSNKKVKDVKLKLLSEDFQLHKDLLPQPFIGNPQAPIWLLLENPGYSAADVYDLKSLNEGKVLLRREGVAEERIIHNHDKSEDELLRVRQSLVCNQLKFNFEDDSAFYGLRPEFNTIKSQRGKTQGGYNWYMKYLCCKSGYFRGYDDMVKALSRNLFLLEYIPYHSRLFHDFGITFAHHRMWKQMVCHAIENKILVARNSFILKQIKAVVGESSFSVAESERRIVLIKGSSVSFSIENTCWPCSFSARLNPIRRQIHF